MTLCSVVSGGDCSKFSNSAHLPQRRELARGKTRLSRPFVPIWLGKTASWLSNGRMLC